MSVRRLQLPGGVVAAALASCLPLLSSLPSNLPAAVDADMRRMGSSLRAGGGGCSVSVSVNSAAAQRQMKAAGRLHHMVLRGRGGSDAEEAVEGDGLDDSFAGPEGRWLDEYMDEETRKEWARAALQVGAAYMAFVLLPIPIVGCFMNRKGLIMGNLWTTLGCLLLYGPAKMASFLTAPQRKLGSAVMAAGLVLIFRGWCFSGFLVELLGVLGLIGERVLRSTLGIIMPILPWPIKSVFRFLFGTNPDSQVANAVTVAMAAMEAEVPGGSHGDG